MSARQPQRRAQAVKQTKDTTKGNKGKEGKEQGKNNKGKEGNAAAKKWTEDEVSLLCKLHALNLGISEIERVSLNA